MYQIKILIFQSKCDTRVVEQYNGECEPPHVVISIKYYYDYVTSTIPKLSLPVTLTGVKQPTTVILKRVPETPSGYVIPLSYVEKSPGQLVHSYITLDHLLQFNKTAVMFWLIILYVYLLLSVRYH